MSASSDIFMFSLESIEKIQLALIRQLIYVCYAISSRSSRWIYYEFFVMQEMQSPLQCFIETDLLCAAPVCLLSCWVSTVHFWVSTVHFLSVHCPLFIQCPMNHRPSAIDKYTLWRNSGNVNKTFFGLKRPHNMLIKIVCRLKPKLACCHSMLLQSYSL